MRREGGVAAWEVEGNFGVLQVGWDGISEMDSRYSGFSITNEWSLMAKADGDGDGLIQNPEPKNSRV